MHIQLIQVPYDSAQRDVRMGHGPEYFVQQGAAETLRAHGWTVDVESIEAQRPFHAEIYTAFELDRQLAQRVRAAKESGAFPLVLSGNCNSSYTEPNGLFVDEMEQAISIIAQQFEIAAAAFTAYDPSCDPEGNILRAGLRLMEHVVGEVEANVQNAS